MTPVQVIFLVTAAVMLFSAWAVVTKRNMVHAALYLILALFGVAVLFVLLEAGFMAVIQVLVYIGAIAILMIFAIMLTRGPAGDDDDGKAMNKNSLMGFLMAALTFEALVVVVGSWSRFDAKVVGAIPDNPVEKLGEALFAVDGFLMPSLVASVLLLGALVGAVAIAWRQDNAEGGE